MNKYEPNIVWERFLKGDKKSFAQIYNHHIDALYKYGTKLSDDDDLVKDAIQEVFIDLYTRRESNKSKPENLNYYLILALKRNLIKKLKHNRKKIETQNFDLIFEPVYSIEKKIIENEEDAVLRRKVSQVLKSLPNKQKEAIYLRFNESLEYDQIAKILNITIDSARKQVYRALKSLRMQFGKKTFLLWLIQ